MYQLNPNITYYATIVGAWGDMFSSYANVALISSFTSIKKINILYYGFDPSIKTFLEIQNHIESVVHVIPKSQEEYSKICQEASLSMDMEWAYNMLPDINKKHIIRTHLDPFQKVSGIYVRNFDYILPKCEIEIKENSILFNPYSIQSVPMRGHWRYIPDALEWLISQDMDVILIGQEKYHHVKFGETEFPISVNHPKVQNLVGKTSMLDVLSLCEKCQGVITTSNSLSMWSIIANKPCIVLTNSMLENPDKEKDTSLYYFKSWIDYPPNQILSNKADLTDFIEVFKKWQSQIGVKIQD